VPVLALFGFAGLRLTAAFSRLSASLQSVSENRRDFGVLMNAIRKALPGGEERAEAPPDDYLAGDRPLPAGTPARFSEALKVENVRFTYPTAPRPAVNDVGLVLQPGSFTAICGATGSGKSTLLLIMMGLLKPDQGEVVCDGWSVFDHVRAWHARIGYVGQRPFVARRSIRENVAFGLPADGIDDGKVWRALELAQIADEIRGVRGDIRARLGDGGIMLSGGQLQRLDLARALYRAPQVLFLDEATAALDNITERKVVKAIRRDSGIETVVCVAHRLSTIRDADVIHVMENGTITGSGPYDRLVDRHAVFAEMAERPEVPDAVT
jgi:ABC-type multidrug transport system fused ATPase/permease subunit